MKKTILAFSIGTALLAGSLNAQVQPLQSGSKVKFEELPEVIKNTVKSQAGEAKIEDIDRGSLNGRTVYEVAFKQNGKHNELRVADDGTVVDKIVEGQSTITASTTAVAATPPPAPTVQAVPSAPRPTKDQVAYDAGFDTSLKKTEKITFDQLPEAVKQVVRERGRNTEIQDVERGRGGGTTAYQIAYKKGGRHVELRLTEDGQKIKEVADGKEIYRQVPASLNQLPPEIRKAITARVGNEKIHRIATGENRTVPFYRVFFTKNGQQRELRITGEDVKEMAAGQPITDPAGTKLR